MTRKILRSIARTNMKKMKMEKINKRRPGQKSIFAQLWRRLAHFMPELNAQRRKKAA